MRVRSVILAALATALLPFGASAQAEMDQAAKDQSFEGKVVYQSSGGGVMTLTLTEYTKGKRLRREMMVPMSDENSPMAGGLMIFDGEARKVAVLATGARKTVMSFAEMVPLDTMAKASGEVKITATGQKETIAGHPCEHYVVQQGGIKFDVCSATGFGFYAGPLDLRPGGGLQRGGGDEAPSGSDWEKKFRDYFKGGFFPLKVTTETPNGPIELVAITVERREVSDDLFQY